MLKRAIKTILTATGLNRVVEAALEVSLFCVFGFGRMTAWLYRRLWPALNIGYYDQRFGVVAGPKSWRWAERGLHAYAAAKRGAIVLDLCCGDGFYAGVFLRELGGEIDGVDRDARAISRARRRYGDEKLRFHVADVLNDLFPQSGYDLVACFASLQYFAPAQAHQLLSKIATATVERRGTFVGSVPVFTAPCKPDPGAARNFVSPDEVKAVLSEHFRDVLIWCSQWSPGATHCYFTCTHQS